MDQKQLENEYKMATTNFLTYQPNQQKLTYSEHFQLLCFLSDLDEIWHEG